MSHYITFSLPCLAHSVKKPGHSAKSAGGELHLKMRTPLSQQSWSGLTMLLSWHNVEPIWKRVHTERVREHSATVISAC